ncbi:hypothetical protein ANANG_G00201050, partial [Anguilla anguilla]
MQQPSLFVDYTQAYPRQRERKQRLLRLWLLSAGGRLSKPLSLRRVLFRELLRYWCNSTRCASADCSATTWLHRLFLSHTDRHSHARV